MVESASWPSERSASDELVLIDWPSSLQAGMQRVGGGLGAGLELIGDGLGAPDQQVLEAADAAVERVGDLERARAQRLVDLGDLGADRVRDLGAARRDGAGDRADAAVERVDDVAGRRRSGGVVRSVTREPRLASNCDSRTSSEPVSSPERPVTPLIEGIDVIAHRLGHVLRALAEPLDQFAAIGLHGAVELGRCGG